MRLSIIIPVRNEADNIVATLNHLSKWRGHQSADIEVIVVDGASDDETASLAKAQADRLIHAEPGRARQMNAAAGVARGQYLLFLHGDTRLPAVDFCDFLSVNQPKWGFFNVRLSGSHWLLRVVERMMCWRSRLTRIATGDQCLWVTRECFQKLGGFADIPLMEDVAICKVLRRNDEPLIHPDTVITSSRRWENQGIMKTIVLMWHLRWRYYRGESPESLVKDYYPNYYRSLTQYNQPSEETLP